ncbi:TetR/AcrR family transcriptional regulator [Acidiferrimicrobium sp. IK]|uniref:TetR/AcrR family transcriptional regulator n=1 Tax=Acidiferrimicrobium sp. IK TaxID=2871700 RepID=UPI0021CB3A25|nr:TetR/AcrR family transcriptional regulator [Acidiferrimicrobium sp. IK]MCU4184614.1 TetR/AcrR family transcriptional regulator [Acidiferrimicrobium sp. IK]
MKAKTEPKRFSRLDSDQRRGQILAAAQGLFSGRPYGAVSTTEIAEAAGVTRGLLHHYFGTKRALYLEVVQELVGVPVVPLLDAITAQRSGSSAALGWEASVDGWMELIEANREAWLLAISAGETGQDRAMHEILDNAREKTASQVLQVLALDDTDMPEVRSLVRAFGGFAEEITREWLERKRISRAQARVLLVGALPLMVEELLPGVAAARDENAKDRRPRRRARRVG